jgi:hypothetical protein
MISCFNNGGYKYVDCTLPSEYHLESFEIGDVVLLQDVQFKTAKSGIAIAELKNQSQIMLIETSNYVLKCKNPICKEFGNKKWDAILPCHQRHSEVKKRTVKMEEKYDVA